MILDDDMKIDCVYNGQRNAVMMMMKIIIYIAFRISYFKLWFIRFDSIRFKTAPKGRETRHNIVYIDWGSTGF